MAFGCPFEGEVPLEKVIAIVREGAALGIGEIALADTIGVADPWTVRARIEAARAAAPDARLRMHFHDTRGTGLANAFASVEAGVTVLDASCGGLGGCPFAPAATGNIATEDLAYMLHRAGFETGLDVDGPDRRRPLDRRKDRQAPGLGAQPGGRVSELTRRFAGAPPKEAGSPLWLAGTIREASVLDWTAVTSRMARIERRLFRRSSMPQEPTPSPCPRPNGGFFDFERRRSDRFS